MDWHILPAELRARNQWVCANDDKEPCNPNTGFLASVADPSTWGTFQQATKAALANGWDIGYILSEDDPFTFVDLDDKESKPAPAPMKKVHADILTNADSYIERSVSGTGYHVVVLGKAPRPIKTDWIEMYSSHRLMICTGNVVKDLPIVDGTPLIELIDLHFGKASTYVDPMGDLPDQAPDIGEHADDEIIRRGMQADNGDKFAALWQGDLSIYNGDHSRADSALLNLLCFLTPHNEQVRRIFRQSKLYRPNQQNRTTNRYLNYSIHKWRAENPPIDLSLYSLDIVEQKLATCCAMAVVEDSPSVPPVATILPSLPTLPPMASFFPPGIIGEVAQYAFETSYTPVMEGARLAAIAYFCGLLARGYHINRLGLNQYFVFIADSGVGKEGGKRAIRAIHAQVYQKVPAAQHSLGSSDFSSGVAFVKELHEQPCMMGIAGEIGMVLKGMLDHRAPSHVQDLKRALTDAWSESGPNGVLNSRRYSDRSKNVQDVKRPAYTMLGESVPSHFYNSLNDEVINDGFIPRWIIDEFPGNRPMANRDGDRPPSPELIDRIADLFTASKVNQDNNQMVAVKLSPPAKALFIKFEDDITDRMRKLGKEHPVKAILNRTNEKALKIAALLAITDNPYEPVVTTVMAEWAQAFVGHCDSHMIARFESGAIGQGEETFESIVRAAVIAYQKMTPAQKQAAKTPKCLLDQPAIPRAFFSDFLKRRAQIKNHRFGSSKAIEVALQEACANALLVELPPVKRNELKMRGGTAYLLGDGW